MRAIAGFNLANARHMPTENGEFSGELGNCPAQTLRGKMKLRKICTVRIARGWGDLAANRDI